MVRSDLNRKRWRSAGHLSSLHIRADCTGSWPQALTHKPDDHDIGHQLWFRGLPPREIQPKRLGTHQENAQSGKVEMVRLTQRGFVSVIGAIAGFLSLLLPWVVSSASAGGTGGTEGSSRLPFIAQ